VAGAGAGDEAFGGIEHHVEHGDEHAALDVLVEDPVDPGERLGRAVVRVASLFMSARVSVITIDPGIPLPETSATTMPRWSASISMKS